MDKLKSKKKLIKVFPDVFQEKIDVIEFLEASTYLVSLVDKLGKVFAPVKYDMQGNIDKIKKCYDTQKDACLLQLMTTERSKGQLVATESVLWLNRALLFFELLFLQIIQILKTANCNLCTSMTKIFTVAYEGSVKKHHNWVNKQLFTFMCKMSPNLQSILSSLGMDDDPEAFQSDMITFNESLTKVRSKIDNYFESNKLFM